MKHPKIGDRVAFSHAYLKSVSADKDIADMRGKIVAVIRPIGKSFYVKVLWDGDIESKGCLSWNLSKVRDFIEDVL